MPRTDLRSGGQGDRDGAPAERNRAHWMGVADSPDLAKIYGYYFERKCRVLEHPNIFYYGRYIDDCLAIVYAETNEDAIKLLSNLVRFDNCVIEWAQPASSQPFLDMLLYQDRYNGLQHLPYRKAGNHQERIPWISAHPYDVKRGTFLGEMSRMAVLSSTERHYLDALRGLVSLYIHRGYPADEVHKWLYSNIQVRWEKRLQQKQPETVANTLVLKTEYNLAWNYFNAHELGQEIFDYWRTWLAKHDARDYSTDYPAPGHHDELPPGETYDLRDTTLFNSRVLVSRKRTRNFLDLTNLWKKTVLENLERDVLADEIRSAQQAVAYTGKRAFDSDINTQVVGPRKTKIARVANSESVASSSRLTTDDLRADDSEMIIPHRVLRYRSHSPGTNEAWRSGAKTTWGRGVRP